MFLNDLGAFLTHHPTTPEELAVTILLDVTNDGVVPPTTAHQFAAIQANACLITLATLGSHRTVDRVEITIIRRVLQVNQVFL